MNVNGVGALARQLSSELAGSALAANAAARKKSAVGVLADPTVPLQAWDVNGRGVGQPWIGVEQEFKVWGERDLERGVAEADAARHQSRVVVTGLIARVKTAARQPERKELTDLNCYANVTVGATFVQRPTGDNAGQFTLGFKVSPQYEAEDAEQRAASSRLGAAQMRYDAIRIRLDGDAVEAWFALEAVLKEIRIVEQGQLNPARPSVEMARSVFAAGTADSATSLEAERRLRAIEVEILKLKVKEQVRYAELEHLAGGSL
ncbi:MAG: hypothetical protein ACR65U_02295 [Methylocystis sp.]